MRVLTALAFGAALTLASRAVPAEKCIDNAKAEGHAEKIWAEARGPGTVAEFATGDAERYLRAIGAEGSHTLLERGRSHILLRADVATRRTALHEWVHRALQRRAGGPRPGEDAFVEAFLDRHKKLFGLE